MAAVGVVLFRLRAYLPPHTLPMRGGPGAPFAGGDLTPQVAVAVRVAIEAVWHQGVLPFWNPLVNAGAPLFETPQAGALSLATWLGGLAPPAAAIKWSLLAHVVLGMAGVCAWARQLAVPLPAGACGALAFGLSAFLHDHLTLGHASQVYALGWVPWTFAFLWRSLTPRPGAWRWAVAAGATLAAQLLEGADSSLLYEAVAMLLLPLAAVAGPGRRRFLVRSVVAGAVAAASSLVLSAFHLLPLLSYLHSSNRGSGLTLGQSLDSTREVLHPVPGAAYLALVALGLGMLAGRREQRRPALHLALGFGLGFAAAYVPAVFAVLWRFVPGFDYQRIPQRALVLSVTFGAVLVAAGVHALWLALGRLPAPVRPLRAPTLAAVATLLAYRLWQLPLPVPPMVDPAFEIASNQAMQWVGRHRDGSRVHVLETVDRHFGSEHVTVPLGIPVIAGYTPAEHRDYMASDFAPEAPAFFRHSYSSPAKLWGVLDVRYVLSTRPRRVDGLALATEVGRCPPAVCQPPKSAGPYVYENLRRLPRAYRVRHAIALLGEERATFEAALALLALPGFDPARCVVLQLPPGGDVPAGVDAVVGVGVSGVGLPAWGTAAAGRAVRAALELAAADETAPLAGQVEQPDVNHLRVSAPGDGWLVVAERLALYPGWRASVAGATVPIVRANGVIAALPVPAGATVALSYRPPGFATGLVVLALGIALGAVVEVGLRRRRRLAFGSWAPARA